MGLLQKHWSDDGQADHELQSLVIERKLSERDELLLGCRAFVLGDLPLGCQLDRCSCSTGGMRYTVEL